MTYIHKTISGKLYRIKAKKPGPKPRGFEKFLVRLETADLAILRERSQALGGYVSVNEMIREAVKEYIRTHIYKSA